jgi:3',5'-cyclic AMP phosphodiesterase CpdA
MRAVIDRYILLLILVFATGYAGGQTTVSTSAKVEQLPLEEQRLISTFADRAKVYVKMRERIEGDMPQLPKDATKEQIQAHHDELLKAVQKERGGAKQGEIFTPAVSEVLRRMIREEFKGRDRADLQKRAFEAESAKVPMKVNVEYPEAVEIPDIPPHLLLALPQLPKQLRYRLVGDYMLLVDRENDLIIDYMTNALPPLPPAVKAEVAEKKREEKSPNSTTAPASAVPQAAKVPAAAESTAAAASAAPLPTLPSPLTLPNAADSLKIVVIGDFGSGSQGQYEVGQMINTYRKAFRFDNVITVGDNIYGSNKAGDMKSKFEDPYKSLFDQGVKFHASLGNHDSSNERFYELFNMKGEEYYKLDMNGISFYVLNSTYMDKRQLDWINGNMSADTNKWKVAFFHHPPFSSAKFHGSDEKIRDVLHPLFIRYGVSVVFTGHDHVYERIKPQDGIQYFVTGSGGQLRKGDLKKGSPLTAAGFDTDMEFMLVEFVGDTMYFQTISRTGQTVDSGSVKVREP